MVSIDTRYSTTLDRVAPGVGCGVLGGRLELLQKAGEPRNLTIGIRQGRKETSR